MTPVPSASDPLPSPPCISYSCRKRRRSQPAFPVSPSKQLVVLGPNVNQSSTGSGNKRRRQSRIKPYRARSSSHQPSSAPPANKNPQGSSPSSSDNRSLSGKAESLCQAASEKDRSSSSSPSSNTEASLEAAKRTSTPSPEQKRAARDSVVSTEPERTISDRSVISLHNFSGEGTCSSQSTMGNCVGRKSVQSNGNSEMKPAPDTKNPVQIGKNEVPETGTEDSDSSRKESDSETVVDPNTKSTAEYRHGSRRRLSLIHADPITHTSAEGPRGTTQIIQKSAAEQRLSLEGVLSKNGAGTRVSVVGAAAQTHQRNFEDKNETCRGNVTGATLVTMGIGHACRKGLKPESPNQDDFFIFRVEHIGLYGVFDGHGPFGHDISNFVQRHLPKLIYNHAEFYTNPKTSLKNAFEKVQEEIEKSCERRDFDAALSGCTATVIVHDMEKHKLYVAHVGDSRAVLAQKAGNGAFTATELTCDHKPTLEGERARIEAKGGEVKRLEGDIPFRVFLKDKMYPGLAMSRALGDLIAVQAGVSSVPDISEWELASGKDQFLIICSDGVWEFISSQESVDLVARHGVKEVQTAADALARESWNKWIVEEGDVVDDITVEVVYLFTS